MARAWPHFLLTLCLGLLVLGVHAQGPIEPELSQVFVPETPVAAPMENELVILLVNNNGDPITSYPADYTPSLSFTSPEAFLFAFEQDSLAELGGGNWSIKFRMDYVPPEVELFVRIGDLDLSGQDPEPQALIGGGSVIIKGSSTVAPTLSSCEITGSGSFNLKFDAPTDRGIGVTFTVQSDDYCPRLLDPDTVSQLGSEPTECFFLNQETLIVNFNPDSGASFIPGNSAGIRADSIFSADGSAPVEATTVVCPNPGALANPDLIGPPDRLLSGRVYRRPLPCDDTPMVFQVLTQSPVASYAWQFLANGGGADPTAAMSNFAANQNGPSVTIPNDLWPVAVTADESYRLQVRVEDTLGNFQVSQVFIENPIDSTATVDDLSVVWEVESGGEPGESLVASCRATLPACALSNDGSVFIDQIANPSAGAVGGAVAPAVIEPPLSDQPASVVTVWDPEPSGWTGVECTACAATPNGQVCKTANLTVAVSSTEFAPVIEPTASAYSIAPGQTRQFIPTTPSGSSLIDASITVDGGLRKRPGGTLRSSGSLNTGRWTHVTISHDGRVQHVFEVTMFPNATGLHEIYMSFSPGGETVIPLRIVGAGDDGNAAACAAGDVLGFSSELRHVGDRSDAGRAYVFMRSTVGVCGGEGDVPDVSDRFNITFVDFPPDDDSSSSARYLYPFDTTFQSDARKPRPIKPVKIRKRIDQATPLLHQGNPGTTGAIFENRVVFQEEFESCVGQDSTVLRMVATDPVTGEGIFWTEVNVPCPRDLSGGAMSVTPATVDDGDDIVISLSGFDVDDADPVEASFYTLTSGFIKRLIATKVGTGPTSLSVTVPIFAPDRESSTDVEIVAEVRIPGAVATLSSSITFNSNTPSNTPEDPASVRVRIADASRAGDFNAQASALIGSGACIVDGTCRDGSAEESGLLRDYATFLQGVLEQKREEGEARPPSSNEGGQPIPGTSALVQNALDVVDSVAKTPDNDEETCATAYDLIIELLEKHLAGLVSSTEEGDASSVLQRVDRLVGALKLAEGQGCDGRRFDRLHERVHEAVLYTMTRRTDNFVCGRTDHFALDDDDDGDSIDTVSACVANENSTMVSGDEGDVVTKTCKPTAGMVEAGLRAVTTTRVCDRDSAPETVVCDGGSDGLVVLLPKSPIHEESGTSGSNALYESDSVNPPGGGGLPNEEGAVTTAPTVTMSGSVHTAPASSINEDAISDLKPACRDPKCKGHGHVTVLKARGPAGDSDGLDNDCDGVADCGTHVVRYTATLFADDPAVGHRASNLTIRGLCGNFDRCVNDDGEILTPAVFLVPRANVPASNATHSVRTTLVPFNRETGETEWLDSDTEVNCWWYNSDAEEWVHEGSGDSYENLYLPGRISVRDGLTPYDSIVETHTICTCSHLSDFTAAYVVEILETQAEFLWTQYLIPTIVGTVLVAILIITSVRYSSTHEDEDSVPVPSEA